MCLIWNDRSEIQSAGEFNCYSHSESEADECLRTLFSLKLHKYQLQTHVDVSVSCNRMNVVSVSAALSSYHLLMSLVLFVEHLTNCYRRGICVYDSGVTLEGAKSRQMLISTDLNAGNALLLLR